MTTKVSVEEGQLAVVHEVISAQAPTLVFLHDSLGCIQTWRDFPEQLAQTINCNYLIYDRLGYGDSSPDPLARSRKKDYLEIEAERLNDLLVSLSISTPILFGHSDGASIALIAAAKQGNRIAGLILEAAHIFVEEITLAGVREARANYPNWLLRGKLQKYHGTKADDVFYSWADTWLREDFRDWSIEAILPQISCPCLIIQGEKDEFGTLRQVEGIEKNIAGPTQRKVLQNVGHSPHKEDRDSTLRVSAAFVEIIK